MFNVEEKTNFIDFSRTNNVKGLLRAEYMAASSLIFSRTVR